MRNIREVLRLRLCASLKYRQISQSTKVSMGSIKKLLSRAEELGLSWPLPDDLDDADLARLFYPSSDTTVSSRYIKPDWSVVHQELKRKGMTKQLLWEEYTAAHPNRCYSYSQYCDRYRRWLKKQKRSMRQIHKAGEKCFVDYCGQTVPIIDAASGEIRQAQIFVGTLGASNYTYAEATYSQTLPEWLASQSRMLEFFGGCPEIIVPDNLKSGVSKCCRYDPDLNPSYQQWAAHYQVAVIPARPYKPKDKAKVEVGVQIVERWILAKLRRQTFFSLAELNRCIASLLDDLNHRPFKQLPGNRQQAFEQLDKPALQPLPTKSYTYVDIKTVKVNIDYHIQYRQHQYSVPHQYVGECLQLHASETLVCLFFNGRSIASHPGAHRPGTTTLPAHMPVRHQKHQQWTPGRLKNWAKDIGNEVLAWVDYQLSSKAHPEQAYRVCLGLLNLSREYPPDRLDKACKIANAQQLYRLKQIKSILQSNRDQLPQQLDIDIQLPQVHENIRGPRDYH
ncbi:MAG: IS21 family transposase [Burkholderiales bacterium]|nr:IS21 family transposase [Nitrosomonas sp.]MCP5276631.1 IS21 family transposase [Burkholderiales bacterium]